MVLETMKLMTQLFILEEWNFQPHCDENFKTCTVVL